jgi:hypothetical protein
MTAMDVNSFLIVDKSAAAAQTNGRGGGCTGRPGLCRQAGMFARSPANLAHTLPHKSNSLEISQ